jgi:hypothetical protein
MNSTKISIMKFFRIIFAIYFSFLILGCNPDKDVFQISQKPDWTVQTPETYPYSLTAVVCLPEVFNTHAQDNDLLSAFIGDDCRGIGNLVKSEDGSKRVYFITVRASATENGNITFRYYNDRLSLLYQAKTTVAFQIDGIYGNYDNPIELDLELL